LGIALAVLAALVILTALWDASRQSVVKEFWEPFIQSPEPVVFCLAHQSQYASIRLRDARDLRDKPSCPTAWLPSSLMT
jgi:hypothetical protein